MIDSPSNRGNASGGRLFVVDHMCVTPYGHNQEAVAVFWRQLRADFPESWAFVPSALSAASATERGFTRCLHYPYNSFYHRRFDRFLRPIRSESIRVGLQLVLRRLEKVMMAGLARLLGLDLELWRTRRNWRKLFKIYAFGAGDLIFFPSADFYGVGALLDLLMDGKTDPPPRVHLRMINVMEHATLGEGAGRDVLIGKIKKAIARGADVRVSGETFAYISYLRGELGTPVDYFPYPLIGDSAPMPRSRPAIAAAIGSGRRDKGYFQWIDITQKAAALGGEPIRFEIQAMPQEDHEFREEYQIALAQLPNLSVLPTTLTEDQMDDSYRRCSIVVLPYDPRVYEYRGSAILQKAIQFGRPVAVLAGGAFADLVRRYQCGYVCEDIDDIVEAIQECARVPPREWERRLAMARELYAADVEQAMDQVLDRERRLAG